MSDATVRTARSSGFTVVQNNAVRDPRLSLSAVGLYVRMMSLPEGRAHSVRYIAKVAGCGRDALRRCFSELEAAGYLVREQQHVEHGKFGANAYLLYDSPILPSTENPSTVNPATAEPTTDEPSPENPSTKEINTGKKYTPIAPSGGEGERFEKFWRTYRDVYCAADHSRAGDKAKARKAWSKLQIDDALAAKLWAYLKAQMQTDLHRRGFGIQYASTFLNAVARNEIDLTPVEASPAALAAHGAPQTPERMEDQWLT